MSTKKRAPAPSRKEQEQQLNVRVPLKLLNRFEHFCVDHKQKTKAEHVAAALEKYLG